MVAACARKLAAGEAMAKKKSRTMKKSEATVPAKRRRIAIGLIVSMLIAGVAFAQWGLFASQKQRINSRPATPPSGPTTSALDSAHASKEYVYAGSRLIATEEPASGGGGGAAPTNLRATAVSGSPPHIHLTWDAVAGATLYDVQRSSNYGSPADHGFGPPVTVNGTSTDDGVSFSSVTGYVYRVSVSGSTSYSNLDVAATIIFAPPSLNGAPIQGAHLLDIRAAVNALRVAAGLPPFSWTDPPPLAGIVSIKAVHINELRMKLGDITTPLGLPSVTYSETVQQGTSVKAVHFQELRNAANGYMMYWDSHHM